VEEEKRMNIARNRLSLCHERYQEQQKLLDIAVQEKKTMREESEKRLDEHVEERMRAGFKAEKTHTIDADKARADIEKARADLAILDLAACKASLETLKAERDKAQTDLPDL
jgi:hypothetical protein